MASSLFLAPEGMWKVSVGASSARGIPGVEPVADYDKPEHALQVVRKPIPHDSAPLQVQGAAPYIDDLREPAGLLHVALGDACLGGTAGCERLGPRTRHVLEHGLHTRIGIGHLARGQLHVELIAVHPQVQIVEPATGGPQGLCSDRKGRDARRFQLFAGSQQLGPGLGRGDALLGKDIGAVVDAPLVVGIGHAPFLAVDRHRRGRGFQLLVEAIGGPDIAHVLEEARTNEGRHAIAGIPSRHIRRIAAL